MNPEKGGAILPGLFVLSALLAFGIYRIGFKRLEKLIPSGRLLFLLFWVMVVSGTFIFSFPKFEYPNGWEILEIRPLTENVQSGKTLSVAIKEIKNGNKPVILENSKPSKGWQLSEVGLVSEPGSQQPVIIKPIGSNQADYTILFDQSQSNGTVRIRVGWNVKSINLAQTPEDPEVSFSISSLSSDIWNLILKGSIWLSSSFLLFLLGLFLIPKQMLATIIDALAHWSGSVFFWLIATFVFWYGVSFTTNVFLNTSNSMQNGNFLPAINPIGNDLDLIIRASKSVAAGGSPYAGANKYPPAATVFFIPLAFMDIRIAFQVITGITYIFFTFITLGLPYYLTKQGKLSSYAWFLFATGLYSYGLLFEIERGQFNLIAMGLTFLAVILFHKTPRFRWLAYIIFCIGVQFKIYPAIFVLFLADDWRDRKKTFIRWVSLGLANIALLFVLGPGIMQAFIRMLTRISSGIGKSDWPVNHAIPGFMHFSNYYLNLPDGLYIAIQAGLTLSVLILIGLCFFQAFQRKTIVDPYLLLACTLGALLFPTLSNDYTLSYLVGPAIFFFTHLENKSNESPIKRDGKNPMTIFLIAISAFALTSTYFSYLQKPILIQNQFPALFLFLICATILSIKETRGNLWKLD